MKKFLTALAVVVICCSIAPAMPADIIENMEARNGGPVFKFIDAESITSFISNIFDDIDVQSPNRIDAALEERPVTFRCRKDRNIWTFRALIRVRGEIGDSRLVEMIAAWLPRHPAVALTIEKHEGKKWFVLTSDFPMDGGFTISAFMSYTQRCADSLRDLMNLPESAD